MDSGRQLDSKRLQALVLNLKVLNLKVRQKAGRSRWDLTEVPEARPSVLAFVQTTDIDVEGHPSTMWISCLIRAWNRELWFLEISPSLRIAAHNGQAVSGGNLSTLMWDMSLWRLLAMFSSVMIPPFSRLKLLSGKNLRPESVHGWRVADSASLCFFKIYLFKRVKERGRSFICWVYSKITARAGFGWNQELVAFSESPSWVQQPKVLDICCFPNCISSEMNQQ